MSRTEYKGRFYRDMTQCSLCESRDKPLLWVGGDNGSAFCSECEDLERNFDVDKHEEDKRRRIAEENEY